VIIQELTFALSRSAIMLSSTMAFGSSAVLASPPKGYSSTQPRSPCFWRLPVFGIYALIGILPSQQSLLLDNPAFRLIRVSVSLKAD